MGGPGNGGRGLLKATSGRRVRSPGFAAVAPRVQLLILRGTASAAPTAVLLLLIVVLLNLTAIVVRNKLRKKYATSAFA